MKKQFSSPYAQLYQKELQEMKKSQEEVARQRSFSKNVQMVQFLKDGQQNQLTSSKQSTDKTTQYSKPQKLQPTFRVEQRNSIAQSSIMFTQEPVMTIFTVNTITEGDVEQEGDMMAKNEFIKNFFKVNEGEDQPQIIEDDESYYKTRSLSPKLALYDYHCQQQNIRNITTSSYEDYDLNTIIRKEKHIRERRQINDEYSMCQPPTQNVSPAMLSQQSSFIRISSEDQILDTQSNEFLNGNFREAHPRRMFSGDVYNHQPLKHPVTEAQQIDFNRPSGQYSQWVPSFVQSFAQVFVRENGTNSETILQKKSNQLQQRDFNVNIRWINQINGDNDNVNGVSDDSSDPDDSDNLSQKQVRTFKGNKSREHITQDERIQSRLSSNCKRKNLFEKKKESLSVEKVFELQYKGQKPFYQVQYLKIAGAHIEISKKRDFAFIELHINMKKQDVQILNVGASSIIIQVNGKSIGLKFKLNSQVMRQRLVDEVERRKHKFQGEMMKEQIRVTELLKDRITQKSFEEISDTGDLLFFQSKSIGSKVQRFFTRCDFDHVALILRYKNSKIVLFESTGQTGVELLRWDAFIEKGFQFIYEQIAYRHLHIARSVQKMKKLEEFIRKNKGKKYMLNPLSMIKGKSEQVEQEGYFCSELVAAAYQHIGILPQNRLPSSYWPSTLAQSSLELEGDVKLSKLIYIDFNR